MTTGKRIILVSLILLVITLSGCRKPRSFNYERSCFDGVESVEIINLTSDDPIDYEVLRNIQGEDLSALLDELSVITFHEIYNRPCRGSGLALKVNYEDRYLLIAQQAIWENNYNNEFIYGSIIDTGTNEELLELINRWIV